MANIEPKDKPLLYYIPTLKKYPFDDEFMEEVYCMFHRYILRPKYSKMWGFPYIDTDGKVKYCSNQFSKRQQANVEICRCGKEISLQRDDWFLDELGCKFHPGKVVYSKERKTDVFTCCNKTSPTPGCAHRKHHVSTSRVCHADDFVKTLKKKHSYLPRLPNVFALDCEMVYTTKGMEVVKVTVLTVFCDVVYDTFVAPRHPVIDYNTEFSGISESHLRNVTVDLKQVQADLLQLFDTETILVGHGLENDLLCLNLFHSKVIDTSILFPHSKGYPWRHSLKTLAHSYLNKEIHCSSKGHDSREDARTCIELIARKIFFSKRKEMKNSYFQRSLMAGYPAPPFHCNKVFSMPDLRQPPPPLPWNFPYVGCYPPYQHGSFSQSRHPLLSYPLYHKKYNGCDDDRISR